MTDAKSLIAVVGPGAVGGLLAWLLHRAAADVVVVGRTQSVARINAEGIRVMSSVFGEGTEFIPARESVPEGASVILAVKTFGLEHSLARIAPSRPRDVLSFMNGIGHATALSQALPGAQVATGSIAVEAIRSADGTVTHKSPFTRLVVPASSAEFASVRALAETPAELVIGGTDAEVLWRKFRFLAPLALLTSYWQTGLGEALEKDPALTHAVLTEVVGCEVAEGVADNVESLTATLAALPSSMRSSLQADLASGRPSELDSIGGELLRTGTRHNLALPAIGTIVAALEQGGPGPRERSVGTTHEEHRKSRDNRVEFE